MQVGLCSSVFTSRGAGGARGGMQVGLEGFQVCIQYILSGPVLTLPSSFCPEDLVSLGQVMKAGKASGTG